MPIRASPRAASHTVILPDATGDMLANAPFSGNSCRLRRESPLRPQRVAHCQIFSAYHDFKRLLQHLCRFADKNGCYIFGAKAGFMQCALKLLLAI